MQTTSKLTKNQIWLLAARPKTLPAAAASAILGSAMAFHDGQFQLLPALAALFISLLLQIGANLANDLFDFQRGADAGERLGPMRVTQAGLLSPQEVKFGLVLVFGSAVLLGIYLTYLAGWVALLIGLSAFLAALSYTGGPFPFGYHSLGDVFVFIFFGPVAVGGTYFVQAHGISLPVLVVGCTMGFLINNILIVNNLRDIHSDQKSQKMTLAVRLGEKGSLIEYWICLIGAYLIPLILFFLSKNLIGCLFSWLSIPLAIRLAKELSRQKGRSLNQTLARTAQLALIYSLLFSFGVILFKAW